MKANWIAITQTENIPLREGRSVKLGEREIAIFNVGDRFLAISNRCPHQNGPLADGIVSGNTVVCPLHAWQFSLETGQGVSGPSASSCVETFRTRVEDGVVMLEVPPDSAAKHAASACIGHQVQTAREKSNSSTTG